MAVSPITFEITDGTGAADATATPSFIAYVERNGTVRTRPGGGAGTIGNKSGGQFGFTPSSADEAAGTIYVIDCGAAKLPRYWFGEISTTDNAFASILVLDEAGALSSGAPTLSTYLDSTTGAARTPPGVVAASGVAYLYSVTPSGADLTVGVSGRVALPANKIPASMSFSFFARALSTTSAPPTVTGVSDPGTDPTAPMVVDVNDDVGFRRVMLLASFSGLTRSDAIYDGASFSQDYGASSVAATATGYRFTIYRRGGWPVGRTTSLNVIPIDTNGNEA